MRTPRRPCKGFTLVEVLVALFAMALLAGLAWQGLDSVLRTREASREAIDRTTRLATVVTQWEQDLQAVHDTGVVPALAFDGQTLRPPVAEQSVGGRGRVDLGPGCPRSHGQVALSLIHI